ncbi:MAG: A/G-specific adenine glycosylase [Chloroflexota bacterium]|nr:A/G-specific adenine glycosylase [Chloroflexota bacterium]
MTSFIFSDLLLGWYKQHARELPWRSNPNPYAVWVSEVMLQQTRVQTVLPYYARWMSRFPIISALANASQHQVLSLWEGLGYYGRARNLHRAAQIVMDEHHGELPRDPEKLRRLPGIGAYTAGAIASIAYGLDEPALDGNIRRVLARCFNVTDPVRSGVGERKLWSLAAENLPVGKAGAYNQALMDLGAIVCTPRSPDCRGCPLVNICISYALGVQEERPVRLAKSAIPHHTVTAAVIARRDQVLIALRPQDGLLGGMWEFPGGKQEPGEELVSCLQREIYEELAVEIDVNESFGVFHHAYTHFRVTLHAFLCTIRNGNGPQPIQVDELRWVRAEELMEYPMGKVDRQISDRLTKTEVAGC